MLGRKLAKKNCEGSRLTKAARPNLDNYSVARFDNDLSKDRAGSH